MAKGSGGVGKKSGSVSGAKSSAKKAAAPVNLASAPLGTFADAVLAQAKKLPNERGQVPISEVYNALGNKAGMTLPEFRGRVVEAWRGDKLNLRRMEMSTDYSTAVLRASETKVAGQEFYFINTRDD
jgi:hypothetical protein